MTVTVKVASIQAPSVLGDVKTNVDRFSKLVVEAAESGAKICVLPEAALTGYSSQDFNHSWCVPQKSREDRLDKKFIQHDPHKAAQPKDGEIVQHFKKLCKELSIYCTVPYVEVVESEPKDESQSGYFEWYPYRYYNAITLVSPKGEAVAHYRKTNLWPYYDNPWATAGDNIVTYQTEYGKVGLGVCFDIHKILPEYKEENIWSLLYCIAWVDDKEFLWFHEHLPKRLRDEEIPYNVIGCNWSVTKQKTIMSYQNDDDEIGEEKNVDIKYDWYGYGKTTIYGPYGKILSTAKSQFDNEIIFAEIPVA